MGILMDLVAGNVREILLAISLEDLGGLDDPDRFDAHLPLGAGLDPHWLDQFSAAVRLVTGGREPVDFSAACWPLEGRSQTGDRTVERVDPDWVAAVAGVTDRSLDAIASRWLDLMSSVVGPLEADDRAAFRELASQLVAFARAAEGSPAVLYAWTI